MTQTKKPQPLRLFALRDLKTGKVGTEYFSDKTRAKAARTEGTCVTYGPDHRHYKSSH